MLTRYYLNPVLDMETLTWSHGGVIWSNEPRIVFKGDDTAKAAENQQMQFDQQLMSIFSQQYANQSGILNYLKGQLEPSITAGGKGYSDADLAAMRTSASDTNAANFQNAEQALNNKISMASGGSKLTGVSGAALESQAGLLNAEAQQEAGSQNQITEANANLKQQNYWAAINALNGVSAQVNPLGYASGATQGSGAVAGLSNAVTNANQSQLLGALGGIAGGGLAGLGTAIGGPSGAGSFGALFGCWVAASFWGWNSLKTWRVRVWMQFRAPAWFRAIYYRYGSQIAKSPLRWAYRPVFEMVLLNG